MANKAPKTYTTSSSEFNLTATIDFNWDYNTHNGTVLEFALSLFEDLEFLDDDSCGGTTLGRPIAIYIETRGRPTKKQRERIYYLQDKLRDMFTQYEWEFRLIYGKRST